MNILLLDGLPTKIDGVPISPDFRNMIQFDIALHDEGMEDDERVWRGLQLLFPGMCGERDEAGQPYLASADLEKAVQDLMWFYTRDARPSPTEVGKPATGRAYDFEQDSSMVYAAFAEAYDILLADCEYMHWWEFMALLEGLPDNTRMARAMYYRTVDLAGMGDSERKHVVKMQRVFALKGSGAELAPEERERRLKERVQAKIAHGRR